jgi:hypothetical protein
LPRIAGLEVIAVPDVRSALRVVGLLDDPTSGAATGSGVARVTPQSGRPHAQQLSVVHAEEATL